MPRSVIALAVTVAAGVAVAQPPVLTSQPQLVVARVKDGVLRWTVTEIVPEDKVTLVPGDRNGEKVMELVIEPRTKVSKTEVVQDLKEVRVTDGTGRPVPTARLAERLGDGAPVVVYRGTLPDEYRRALRDDAVLIELPATIPPQPTQRVPVPLSAPPPPPTMPPPAALPAPAKRS